MDTRSSKEIHQNPLAAGGAAPLEEPIPSRIRPPAPQPGPAKEQPYQFRNLRARDIHSLGHLGGPARRGKIRQLMFWSLAAASLDLFLIMASTSFFSFIFGYSLRFFHWLGHVPIGSGLLRTTFIAIFFLQYFLYMLAMRYFFGRTLGEYFCQLRLALSSMAISGRRDSLDYLLRVIWRTTLILLTGGVTLPLLSLVLGIDLIGRWTGVILRPQL